MLELSRPARNDRTVLLLRAEQELSYEDIAAVNAFRLRRRSESIRARRNSPRFYTQHRRKNMNVTNIKDAPFKSRRRISPPVGGPAVRRVRPDW